MIRVMNNTSLFIIEVLNFPFVIKKARLKYAYEILITKLKSFEQRSDLFTS